MERKRRIVIAIVILVAAPLALLMAMGCMPEMTYQGVLTDASGRPVPDGAYTMQFRLLNVSTAPVFTQTSSVTVTNGIFNVVLGEYGTNPLPVDKFSQPLQLEITVNGDVLSPNQALLGAPYAFSLAPGAVIYDDISNVTGNPALTIQKESDGAALRLEGGALQSDQDSYWWYDANGMQSDDLEAAYTGVFAILNSWQGGVEFDCSALGNDLFVLPLDVPTVLYGESVWLEEVRVYYRTTNAATYIMDTWVYHAAGVGSYSYIAVESNNQDSTTATSYPVPVLSIDDTSSSVGRHRLSATSGSLLAVFALHCGNTTQNIYISGVRLRLGHTD